MEKLITAIGRNKNVVVASMSLMLVSMSTLLLLWDQDLGHHQKASIVYNESSLADQSPEWKDIIQSVEDDQFAFVLNNDGEIIYIDSNLTNILEYQEDEVLGKKLFPLIHEEDLSEMMVAMVKVMQSTEPLANVGPFRISSSYAGEYRDFIATLTPVVNSEDKIINLVGVLKDITTEVDKIQDSDDENKTTPEKDKIRNQTDEEDSRKIVNQLQK